MQLAEVVIREIERDRSFKIFQFLAKGIRQARQSAAVHSQRVVLFLDMRR
jgi:hypothetical protein